MSEASATSPPGPEPLPAPSTSSAWLAAYAAKRAAALQSADKGIVHSVSALASSCPTDIADDHVRSLTRQCSVTRLLHSLKRKGAEVAEAPGSSSDIKLDLVSYGEAEDDEDEDVAEVKPVITGQQSAPSVWQPQPIYIPSNASTATLAPSPLPTANTNPAAKMSNRQAKKADNQHPRVSAMLRSARADSGRSPGDWASEYEARKAQASTNGSSTSTSFASVNVPMQNRAANFGPPPPSPMDIVRMNQQRAPEQWNNQWSSADAKRPRFANPPPSRPPHSSHLYSVPNRFGTPPPRFQGFNSAPQGFGRGQPPFRGGRGYQRGGGRGYSRH